MLSFDKQKQMISSAVVLRDYLGRLITGSSRMFATTSPLIAEAYAVRDALVLARNMDLHWIYVEKVTPYESYKAVTSRAHQGRFYKLWRILLLSPKSLEAVSLPEFTDQGMRLPIWLLRKRSIGAFHCFDFDHSSGYLSCNPNGLFSSANTDDEASAGSFTFGLWGL